MIASSGLFISAETLEKFPPTLKAQLLGEVFGYAVPDYSSEATDVQADADSGSDEYDTRFAELSPGQARDFLIGCGAKTKVAVEVIAKSKSKYFQLADIAKALQVDASQLNGVWGGLTKRTKTITKDKEAYLIHWSGKPVLDAEGNYIDQQGEVTDLTYASFRKALSIK